MKTGIPEEWEKEWEDFNKLSLLPSDRDTATSHLKFLSQLTQRPNTLIDLQRDIISLEMFYLNSSGAVVRWTALTAFKLLDEQMPDQFFQDLLHLSIPLGNFLGFVQGSGNVWWKLLTRYKGLRHLALPSNPPLALDLYQHMDLSSTFTKLGLDMLPISTPVVEVGITFLPGGSGLKVEYLLPMTAIWMYIRQTGLEFEFVRPMIWQNDVRWRGTV